MIIADLVEVELEAETETEGGLASRAVWRERWMRGGMMRFGLCGRGYRVGSGV